MAKKAKDTAAAAAKKKPAAPLDPVKTRKLLSLLGAVALLLAIAAFVLQLLAVLSHHWKWQSTNIDPLTSQDSRYPRAHIYNDSRLDQQYGLYSRNVKLYANNDEQLDLWASTRFPRLDADEDSLHRCLSQTSTLRGAFLTCSSRVVSPDYCHCRRHAYWNWVIFFEVTALILLGLALLVTALVSTDFNPLLRLAAAGLAILAFLFLFIGLILILSYLKRETQSLADAYPHIHQRLTGKLGLTHEPYRGKRTKQSILHQVVRRQAHETYRLYPLGEGQHPHNATHYQEFSHELNNYVFKPYSDLYPGGASYVPQPRQSANQAPQRQQATHSNYGPVIGYDQVFDNTRACIGWSTVLSILAMILALLYPLLLAYAWLTDKKLNPTTKKTTTTTTTTTQAEYVPLTQEIPASDVVVSRPAIPTEYDHRRPIGEALVKTQHVPQPTAERVEVRDVVITDAEAPVVQTTTQEQTTTATNA
ncbi:unnamed protein product [Adineta ricciae]|uniref:Uncharacterized protein n=1 Tax=Adineta ricciae TaxID=249248 RepID=A0A815SV06_ADIRI|nr:unnamed protein product [Adineta ricciae]